MELEIRVCARQSNDSGCALHQSVMFLFERFSLPMNRIFRASCLGYKELTLIPAFSPRRRRIIHSRLDASKIASVQGFNARPYSGKSHPPSLTAMAGRPLPSPLGEGELSADGLERRKTISVHGPNACEKFERGDP